MRPELRNEMLRILANAEEGHVITRHFGMPAIELEALDMLEDAGAVSMEAGYAKLTIDGYDYYQELKRPRRYWLGKHVTPRFVFWTGSIAVIVIAALILRFL